MTLLTPMTPKFSLTFGKYKSKEALMKAVEKSGHHIGDWAKELINSEEFTLLKNPERYDFFECTVRELTGNDRVTTVELYQKLYSLGYCDAPDESALLIRMEYTDQPMDEWRSVLSKPRAVADGLLRVLSVERCSDGSFVHRYYADPDSIWRGHGRLLVCRKYQSLATGNSELLSPLSLALSPAEFVDYALTTPTDHWARKKLVELLEKGMEGV